MTDSQPDCSVDARRNRLKLYAYYGFHQEGTYSLDLSLVIEVLAKASGPRGEGWEVKMRWEYRSAEMDLFEATKDEAALLRHWISAGQQQLAEQIINDLILRPKSVRVTGTYYSHAARNNFVPDAGEPATVRRLPLRSRLVYVPEQRLSE